MGTESQCGGFTEERRGLRRGCKGVCPASWMKDRRRVGKGPVQEMTLQSRGGKKGDIHPVPGMMLSSLHINNVLFNPSSGFAR